MSGGVLDPVRLQVAEIFGPTLQGEGPTAGRRAAFVRLGLCNLSCTYCDTPYTWDWTGSNGTTYDRKVELHPMTVGQIVQALDPMHVDRVVITGGEPMVQARKVEYLARALAPMHSIEVETNGTIAPSQELLAMVSAWNVSPKLDASGCEPRRRLHPEQLARFVRIPTAVFKFVVTKPLDVDEVAALVDRFGIPPERVWLMPEGRDADELTARMGWVADAALGHGYNATTRLHVLAWSDERGR